MLAVPSLTPGSSFLRDARQPQNDILAGPIEMAFPCLSHALLHHVAVLSRHTYISKHHLSPLVAVPMGRGQHMNVAGASPKSKLTVMAIAGGLLLAVGYSNIYLVSVAQWGRTTASRYAWACICPTASFLPPAPPCPMQPYFSPEAEAGRERTAYARQTAKQNGQSLVDNAPGSTWKNITAQREYVAKLSAERQEQDEREVRKELEQQQSGKALK